MQQYCNRRSACDSAQQFVGADAHIGPFVRIHRTAVKCSDTAAVASQTYFFCLARKSRQKDALGDAPYCALTRAIFWPLRGLNALFGRRSAIFPIAFGSDECTTRICGQTASISLPLISGILGLL